jgi:hypothetical protein
MKDLSSFVECDSGTFRWDVAEGERRWQVKHAERVEQRAEAGASSVSACVSTAFDPIRTHLHHGQIRSGFIMIQLVWRSST